MKSYPKLNQIMFCFDIESQNRVIVDFYLKERMVEVRNFFHKKKYTASENPTIHEAERLMTKFLETPIKNLDEN